MLELGSLLGAIITGMFADRFSRRQAIIFACGMFRRFATFVKCAFQTDLRGKSSSVLALLCNLPHNPSTISSLVVLSAD